MSEYLNTTNNIVFKITELNTGTVTKLKPLLLKLAEHIATGLRERKPEAINQSKLAIGNSRRHSTEPENILHVSKIICYLKDKYFPSVSKNWIIENLPSEYKEPRSEFKEREKEFDMNILSDKDLIDHGQDIMRRYKKLTSHGPSQDIRMKTIRDVEENSDEFPLKDIWIEIYKNMFDDWKSGKVNDDVFKEIARRFKSISDKRFATDEAKYEAILLACSTYDSLNNSTKYETEILSRWELFDREKKCRKCYYDLSGCRADKCSCACHESVKRLTTKGLKWAKEHNPHLKKLDEQIERLSEWSDDICAFGKALLRNPHIEDHMKKKDVRNIMYNHIEKDKCEVCEFFLEDHPNFFEEQSK